MSAFTFPELFPGDLVLYKTHPDDTQWEPFEVFEVNGDSIVGRPLRKFVRNYDQCCQAVYHADDPRLKDPQFMFVNFPPEDYDGLSGIFVLHPRNLQYMAQIEALWRRVAALERKAPSTTKKETAVKEAASA